MADLKGQLPPIGEKEIARILQRAVELQKQDQEHGLVASDAVRGVSLSELKQIAGEVGIDPRAI